ncbi:uncharacterized protein Bfra_004963 [Botrytis fragariae]|uniref:Uncharacterized protein n=1 Tax=Botrytis fragariae TaxID=1964551 RepID=A0A8H6ATT4_9HELO|nr:uncharacterized protein Bfra_004963 [Botrytis fragariae]KAF5873502.1 hypothetical protein Bfra_004963 [Botrytis fragariae]
MGIVCVCMRSSFTKRWPISFLGTKSVDIRNSDCANSTNMETQIFGTIIPGRGALGKLED